MALTGRKTIALMDYIILYVYVTFVLISGALRCMELEKQANVSNTITNVAGTHTCTHTYSTQPLKYSKHALSLFLSHSLWNKHQWFGQRKERDCSTAEREEFIH